MVKPDSGRKPGMPQIHVLVVVVFYFLVGTWMGWAWKSSSSPNLFDSFHAWFFDNRLSTWQNTYWLGVQIEKCPFDTWAYQEIIYETKPDVLVEAGTGRGGSAYYFASIFDMTKRGRVLTIDTTAYPDRPQHPRITYLLGSSTSDTIFQEVKNSIHPGERVMVSLDSDHRKAHVLNELKLYSTIVTVGNYLVVEDTDINGHPVLRQYGPGPREAVEEFLKNNNDFIQDGSREKFGVTMFPGGWLKRVR